MFWSGKPFVRIFIFFITGVLLTVWIPRLQTVSTALLFSAILFLMLINLWLTIKNKSRKLRILNGLSAGLLIISIGITLTAMQTSLLNLPVSTMRAIYIGKVVKEPAFSEKSVKIVIQLESFEDSVLLSRTDARVMVFFEKDSLSNQLEYGDKLIFTSWMRHPEGPKNPGEFDYARFLKLNNINYVAYAAADQWSVLEKKSGFSIFTIAYSIRHRLLSEMQRNGLSGDDFAVAAAILLGYDNLMDPELQQDYKTAGVMHILVVSGQHVGIIYLVFNFLLGFLNRNKFQKYSRFFLLLLLVWSYALLTGLTPSVQRSAVMISMFIFASATSRFRDNFNTLAASAVLLIAVDPLVIFNIGFQLSYIAVFGILFFYNSFSRLFHIKNKLLLLIWEIIAVSASAQLVVFPLAAHYFHFFPNYFLLSNILIIPLSFLIISGGLFFMAVFWIPGLSQIAGFILSKLVFTMNYLVGLVKYIPFSGINDLYFPWMKVIVVYSIIFFAFYWIMQRKIRFLFPTIISIFILAVFQFYRVYQVNQQNMITVYNINNHTAIDFVKGKNHVMLADSNLVTNEKQIGLHLEGDRINLGLAKNIHSLYEEIVNQQIGLFFDGNIVNFNNFTFLIVDDKDQYFIGNFKKPRIDAVLISGANKITIQHLKECFEFNTIIIDGSQPAWKIEKMKKECSDQKINVIDTNTNGSAMLEL